MKNKKINKIRQDKQEKEEEKMEKRKKMRMKNKEFIREKEMVRDHVSPEVTD